MFLWGLILLSISGIGIYLKLIGIEKLCNLEWVDILILSIWVLNAWRGVNLIGKTIQ